MSEIAVSKDQLNVRFDDALVHVDALDTTLAGVPDAPDGGIASELIGFAMAAALDAAGTTADGYRALIAVAKDVLEDFSSNEQRAVEELADLKSAVQDES
ncbi:hypothetical protein Lsed01_02077 [Demequina sediminis]|uniref:Uncharacterized protein n=1 Tax=Demequina sediminis TaxID=1930058 RepID=A0ABP9WKJ1_9MICO|nr:hypothetical protein [Demequina sediminis]BDZ61557.1 hypothetical protein GCM10025873_13480 [Demequina sediminis]